MKWKYLPYTLSFPKNLFSAVKEQQVPWSYASGFGVCCSNFVAAFYLFFAKHYSTEILCFLWKKKKKKKKIFRTWMMYKRNVRNVYNKYIETQDKWVENLFFILEKRFLLLLSFYIVQWNFMKLINRHKWDNMLLKHIIYVFSLNNAYKFLKNVCCNV